MPSYKDIQKQIATLQKQADEARKKEVSAAIADIRAKMDEFGITVADLQKGAAKRTAKSTAKGGRGQSTGKAAPRAARSASAPKPKYKDPVSGSTWSGRGRKPGWIIAALEQNKSLDEFLI